MNGIINVLKPPGMTSHDVVDFIRDTLNVSKAGHTGTLDPGAAGVMVICLGRSTRIAQFITSADKQYRAEITFGANTSTGDSFGEVIARYDASGLTESAVRTALKIFTGRIEQVPPMVSALKWHGKKLYELARAGQVAERKARVVTINSLEYIKGDGWGTTKPVALLDLTCSKGTYVRTLCTDIGNYLGCGACMSFLVRTRVGAFNISEAYTLEDIKANANDISRIMVTMENVLAELPPVKVKYSAVSAVSSGSKLYLPGIAELPNGLDDGVIVRLQGPEGLLAVAKTARDPVDSSRWIFRPICVLV
ncbi:MAG: tRNA pseudouridine(55) synthase TruB [Desulfotomaculaceae bacterium]|nr:tRNA pseudouridine(55) synthase TruB [Desulfotomaculaceae bacterium]